MSPARPSKTALFRMLAQDLAEISGDLGIDAACGTMKNSRLFKTKRYLGIDISQAELDIGLASHPDATGMVGDLARVDLPKQAASVVVSTNTMFYLTPDDRKLAILNLYESLTPEGTMLLHFPLGSDWNEIEQLLRERFENVSVFYVRNLFSQLFESVMEDDEGALDRPFGSKAMRAVSRGLSIVERSTTHLKTRLVNNGVYVRASVPKRVAA